MPAPGPDLPANTFKREDFPAPLGPKIAQILPDGT